MTKQEQSAGGADKPSTKAILGLAGLTINAPALSAPGAFLWLTYQKQSFV
jgi:hypothetical protein